jgi:hypothetical protein
MTVNVVFQRFSAAGVLSKPQADANGIRHRWVGLSAAMRPQDGTPRHSALATRAAFAVGGSRCHSRRPVAAYEIFATCMNVAPHMRDALPEGSVVQA